MKILNHSFRRRRGFYQAVAARALRVGRLVFAMATSPSLHELIHKDARDPGHECAAVLLLHGQVDSPTPDSPPPAQPVAADQFVIIPSSFVSFNVFVLPPGRAPPVSLLAS